MDGFWMFIVLAIMIVAPLLHEYYSNKKEREHKEELEKVIEDNRKRADEIYLRNLEKQKSQKETELAVSLNCNIEEAQTLYNILTATSNDNEYFSTIDKTEREKILLAAKKEYTEKNVFKDFAIKNLIPLVKQYNLKVDLEDIERFRVDFIERSDISDIDKLKQIEYRNKNSNCKNTKLLLESVKTIFEDDPETLFSYNAPRRYLFRSEIKNVIDAFCETFNLSIALSNKEVLINALNSVEMAFETFSLQSIFMRTLFASTELNETIDYIMQDIPCEYKNNHILINDISHTFSQMFFNVIHYDIFNAIEVFENNKEKLRLIATNFFERDKPQIEDFFETELEICALELTNDFLEPTKNTSEYEGD